MQPFICIKDNSEAFKMHGPAFATLISIINQTSSFNIPSGNSGKQIIHIPLSNIDCTFAVN